MSRIAELGIAKRLGIMVLCGAVALAVLTVIGVAGQRRLNAESQQLRRYLAGSAALNHLDTRQSELKVDAYRAALGQDVTGDVVDDVASAQDAVRAVQAEGLTGEVGAGFAAALTDIDAFGTFISDYVRRAGADRAGALANLDEIADRNNVVDDQLDALHESLDKAVTVERAGMDSTARRTELLSWVVVSIGLVLL